MKNYAAILIGVNEYQFFHPLSYAKQDAQALELFLVEQAGFAPDRCWVLAQNAPQINSHSSYPERQNLLERIDDMCRHQLQAGDTLWFFFSGYGASWNNEDYLLPIDGKIEDIPGTGIPIRTVFKALQSCSAEQLLVLLDIKRPIGITTAGSAGTDTAELALEMEIPTLISCQPTQISGETALLQQGFFTAALLQALKSGECRTLDNLEAFLIERLPQLCEENLSAQQEPLTAIPHQQRHREILPEINQIPSHLAWVTGTPVGLAQEINGEVGTSTRDLVATATAFAQPTRQRPVPVANNVANGSENTISEPAAEPVSVAATNGTPPAPPSVQEKPKRPGPLWLAALGVFVLMLLGIHKLTTMADSQSQQAQQSVATSPAPKPTAPASSIAPPPATPEKAATPQPKPAAKPKPAPKPQKPATAKKPVKVNPASTEKLEKANLPLETATASQFSDAIAQARTIPKNDPLYPQAQQNIDRWSQVILDIAIGRAKQGNYQSAIATAKLVPTDRPAIHSQAKKLTVEWQKQSQLIQTNQKRLDEAQKLIRWGDASSYSKAIQAAAKIPAGQPKHKEAKNLINKWSDSIWQIAQYRAGRGFTVAAIQAAQLVPKNTPAYPDAQKALQQWKSPQR